MVCVCVCARAFFSLRRGNLHRHPGGVGSIGFIPGRRTLRGTYLLKLNLHLRLVLFPRGNHREVLLRGGQFCLTGTTSLLAASAAASPLSSSFAFVVDSSSFFALPDGIKPLHDGRRKGHYRIPAHL